MGQGRTLELSMSCCCCSCWDGWRRRDLEESVGNRAAFQGSRDLVDEGSREAREVGRKGRSGKKEEGIEGKESGRKKREGGDDIYICA